MPIAIACPSCNRRLNAPDAAAAKNVNCPTCGARLPVPGGHQPPAPTPAATPARAAPLPLPPYPRMQRELLILQIRQGARGLCDATGLGPTVGGRFCCVLLIALVPFAISLALSTIIGQETGQGVLQALGAFLVVVVSGSLLVGWAGDEELGSRRNALAQAVPTAAAAWREEKRTRTAAKMLRKEQRPEAPTGEKELARESARPAARVPAGIIAKLPATTKKCPFCAEVIKAEARKCRYCGEMLDTVGGYHNRRASAVHIHVQASNKSPGGAAALEVFFALFVQTFGIGHIYAGNFGGGLFLMFGYWFFLFANFILLPMITCGVWLPIALFLVPACWFLAIILSPMLAARAVRESTQYADYSDEDETAPGGYGALNAGRECDAALDRGDSHTEALITGATVIVAVLIIGGLGLGVPIVRERARVPTAESFPGVVRNDGGNRKPPDSAHVGTPAESEVPAAPPHVHVPHHLNDPQADAKPDSPPKVGRPQASSKPTLPEAPAPVQTAVKPTDREAPVRIPYRVVEQWNGDLGRSIVIDPAHQNEKDMRALGDQLNRETSDDAFALIFIYDDEKAARMRRDALAERLSEADVAYHDRHCIANFTRGAVPAGGARRRIDYSIFPNGLTGRSINLSY